MIMRNENELNSLEGGELSDNLDKILRSIETKYTDPAKKYTGGVGFVGRHYHRDSLAKERVRAKRRIRRQALREFVQRYDDLRSGSPEEDDIE